MKKITATYIFIFTFAISVFSQTVNYENICYRNNQINHNVVNIIHLTDIHLNINNCNTIDKFKRYCDTIATRYDTAQTYIVITGDFADSNDENEIVAEMKLAKEIIDTNLNGFDVFVCPGNHDYSKDFRNFTKNKIDSFDTIFYGNTEKKYPDTISYPNEKLLFIGLNSMDGAKYKFSPFKMAFGKIKKRQREQLEAILTDTTYRHYTKIVYMHHALYNSKCKAFPKQFLKMHCKFKLKNILEENANLLLNGHRHKKFAVKKYKLQIVESNSLQSEKTAGYYVISISEKK